MGGEVSQEERLAKAVAEVGEIVGERDRFADDRDLYIDLLDGPVRAFINSVLLNERTPESLRIEARDLDERISEAHIQTGTIVVGGNGVGS